MDRWEDNLTSKPEFQRMLDQLEAKKEKWISLKDRMPEVNENVLVYDLYENYDVGWIEISSTGYRSFWFSDDRQLELNEVTHWMPLPAPPITKEKENENP